MVKQDILILGLHPFLLTIAARTKLSKSTVGKALKELEQAGLLEMQQRYSRRGGSSNLYRLRKVAEVYPDLANVLAAGSEREKKDELT